MNPELVVVSGPPRSGTSMMMQMLQAGGIEVYTDGKRCADVDNPQGYFEFEAVKNLRRDTTWISQACGKAVKVISHLLTELPPTERYRVLFMNRDLEEVLASQEKMLARLERPPGQREQIKNALESHLNKVRAWLAQRPNFCVLEISHAALIADSQKEAKRIADFLGRQLDIPAMATIVATDLYRNRQSLLTAKSCH